jgi:hypothetical protein
VLASRAANSRTRKVSRQLRRQQGEEGAGAAGQAAAHRLGQQDAGVEDGADLAGAGGDEG